MATALPVAGDSSLYVDRATGPLPGTIAGIGAWFSPVVERTLALAGVGR